MKTGDKVRFTGHGYRRAIKYKYDKLFGDKTHVVKDVRTSCCNTFLVLKDIEGMYCEVFFTKVTE